MADLKGGDNQRKKMRGYVEQIESCHAELEQIAAERMSDSKAVRAKIRDILKDAKSDGIMPKALKAVVLQRSLAKKSDDAVVGLDIDEMSQVVEIQLALDFEGISAVKKAAAETRAQA